MSKLNRKNNKKNWRSVPSPQATKMSGEEKEKEIKQEKLNLIPQKQ